MAKAKKKIPDPTLADFEAGVALLAKHPAFAHLRAGGICRAPNCPQAPKAG